jgi:hypothetical protein
VTTPIYKPSPINNSRDHDDDDGAAKISKLQAVHGVVQFLNPSLSLQKKSKQLTNLTLDKTINEN